MDRDGALAARGTVDGDALARLLADPWFERPMPKSLDRDAFSAAAVAGLSTEDGAATLTAFTIRTIVTGIAVAGGADRVIIAGGGAANPVMRAMIGAAAKIPVSPAGDVGWSPDFLEAEAFAYLAARSLRGLPITFPGTTGVAAPMTGGKLAQP
jgi:anhydro-N-acetylmuramic acid kinase